MEHSNKQRRFAHLNQQLDLQICKQDLKVGNSLLPYIILKPTGAKGNLGISSHLSSKLTAVSDCPGMTSY